MSNKKLSELPSFRLDESGFQEMAVTVNQEIRRVHIGEHSYINEDEAIDRIKQIYRDGKVPFILPVSL